MKKIYLLLMLLIVGVAANAQRKIRLIGRIDTPVINQNITTSSIVSPVYVIKNVGTTAADSLGKGEQIRFISPTSAMVTSTTVTVTTLTLGQALKAGDSLRVSSATITGGYTVKFDSIKTLLTNAPTPAIAAKPFTNNTQYIWYFGIAGVNILAANPPVDSTFTNTDTQKIWINKSPTGIDEISFEEPMSIKTFPNPAANQLSFEYNFLTNEKATATIMDAAGRTVLVKEFENNNIGNQRFDLDITSVSSGMYFLKLNVGEKSSTTKFNVQK